MTRPATISAEIARCQQGEALPSGADGAALAREYAVLCNLANQRLSRCGEWLRIGMFTEALQAASEEPPLLELVQQLAPADTAAWRQRCQQQNWSVPEALDRAAVQLLDTAGRASPAVEKVKKQYRRAVFDGNLRVAVCLLRALADHEHGVAHWREDLNTFERRRLQQLPAEMDAVAAAGNLEDLQALAAELDLPWSVTPSDALRERASALVRELQEDAAARRAAVLIRGLSDAYAARDAERAGPPLAELSGILESGLLKPDTAMRTQFEEARDWHAEERRKQQDEAAFNEGVAALLAELDKPHPEQELPQLWTRLERMDRPIPDALRQRATVALNNLALMRRRRRLSAAAAVTTFLVLATWVIAAYALRLQRERLTREWATNLDQVFKTGDPALCESRVDSMLTAVPAFAGTPLEAWARGELLRVREAAAAKARLIADLLGKLEAIQAREFKAEPALVDALFRQAQQHISGPPDAVARLTALHAEWSAHRQAAQEQRDAQLRLVLDRLTTLFAAGEGQKAPPEALRRQFPAIERLLADGEAIQGAAAELVTQLQAFRQRAQTIAQGIRDRDAQVREVNAAQTLIQYLDAVRTLVAAFPDDPLARRLAPLVAREKGFLFLAAMPPLRQALPARGWVTTEIADVRALDPQDPYWQPTVALLQQHQQRLLTKWQDVRKELLALGDIRSLVELRAFELVTRAKDGSREVLPGFVDGEFAEKGGRINGVFVRQSVTGRVYLPSDADREPQFTEQTFAADKEPVENVRLMDHCRYVRSLIDEVRRLQAEDSLTADLWLARKLEDLRTQPGLPPLLRVRMLEFQLQQLGGLIGEENMTPWKALAAAARNVGPGLSWMCSRNPAVMAAEKEALALFAVPAAAPSRDYAFSLALHRAAVARAVKWIGFAKFDEPAQVQMKTTEPAAKFAEYWVVRPRAGGLDILVARELNAAGTAEALVALEPGEPVFAPTDGLTTPALLAEIRRQCDAAQLPVRAWPAAWPANRR